MNSTLIRLAIAYAVAFSINAFAADKAAKDVDNSAVNQRDQSGQTVTSDDQTMGSKNDVEFTRLVRRALTKDDKLSIYAQNVKIVTLDGKITLRGPVHTEEERMRVATLAQKAVGGQQTIINQLEVKQK